MESSPKKSKSVFSASPSKSPSKRARTDEKPAVKFHIFNKNTYKSGLVCLKFDQGPVSDDLREGLKKLKDKAGKFIVSFNSGKRREGEEGFMEWSASLPPPLHTRAQHSCHQLTFAGRM